MSNEKVVLAYSGGLDTSVMIPWLKANYGMEVIACIVDVGQEEDLSAIRRKALKTGAVKAVVMDARREFAERFIFPALSAHALYEGRYYLATALARPLIAEKVVAVAKKEKAAAVAHGATGKGNDQVRFEVTFAAIAPRLKVIAPWREWEIKSRSEAIAYARRHGIFVSQTVEKPYSSDANLWHISYEGGILEDPSRRPNEDMFHCSVSPQKARATPVRVRVGFERGSPVRLNGERLDPVSLIRRLNHLGGACGLGRVDMVENRLVGIKSRGVYECPAAVILYAAHREMESLVLDREISHEKELVSLRFAEIIYYGLWHTPLRRALEAFIRESQKNVSGEISLELYRGTMTVCGRSSKNSLYWQRLATFEKEDLYRQKDAEGFIRLFGLPYRVRALRGQREK